MLTTEEELDLAMREADVAIRLRQPTQPDLIQRKLFSVHFHIYASPEYLKRFGTPRALEDLDNHRVLVLGGNIPTYLQRSLWLTEVARNGKGPRTPHLVINNILGILRACQRGIGIAMLPDYLVEEDGGLVQLFSDSRPDRARRLFRLSGRTQDGRARAGLPRFSGRQRAALELLGRLPSMQGARGRPRCAARIQRATLPALHGWHARRCIVRSECESHSGREL